MKLELLGLIFGLVTLETMGQFLARKYYANKNELWLLIVSIFCYIPISYTLVKTYSLEEIGFVNAIWSGTALITEAPVGYFFFEETFTNQEYIAIGLIFLGTIILALQNR